MGRVGVGDMKKRVYDPDNDGLIAVAQIEMVAARLAQGQGLGSGSIEIVVPAAGATIVTGSYTGNGGVGRQITVGFKCSRVIIMDDDATNLDSVSFLIPSITKIMDGGNIFPNNYLHAADGFVVDNSAKWKNFNGNTYYYWAISE